MGRKGHSRRKLVEDNGVKMIRINCVHIEKYQRTRDSDTSNVGKDLAPSHTVLGMENVLAALKGSLPVLNFT